MGTKQFDSATDLITFTRASGGTFLGSNGLLQTATNNTPRIEYNADGTVKGLLIEEARTNLIPYSNIDTVNWATGAVTLSDVVLTNPLSQATVAKVVPIAGNSSSSQGVVRGDRATVGVTHTYSVFVKAAGYDAAFIVFHDRTNVYGGVAYDLSTASLIEMNGANDGTLSNPFIEDFGGGWYRIGFTHAGDGGIDSSNGIRVGFTPTGLSNTISYVPSTFTADGVSGGYVAGAQLEAGAFPTSYIPTTGSTATRAADVATIPTANFGYNSDAGSVLVEAQRFGTNNYPRSVMIDAGSESNSIGLGAWGPNTSLTGYIVSGNVVQAAPGTGNVGSSAFKNSLAYKENNFAASRDGGAVVTDTSGVVPTGLTTLRLGRNGVDAQFLNGHIKSIQYYPRRLSNAQLQELTT